MAGAVVAVLAWGHSSLSNILNNVLLMVAIRGLLRASASPGTVPLGSALAWCGGIMVVSVAVSAILFRRRTAS
jgi:hypothetical protein